MWKNYLLVDRETKNNKKTFEKQTGQPVSGFPGDPSDADDVAFLVVRVAIIVIEAKKAEVRTELGLRRGHYDVIILVLKPEW